jgi:hypothetical protein
MKNLIKWLFILSGAKLYMDWILPTNPSSKNPLIKFIYGWAKEAFVPFYIKNRIIQGLILMSGHTLFYLWYVLTNTSIINNLLFNVYPIIVQLYVISRLYPIMLNKRLYNKI